MRRDPRRRGRHLFPALASPLTRRILAVNLLAPLILAAGLMWLDRYKQELIEAELDALSTQAEMVAGAVAEGAVGEDEEGSLEIRSEIAPPLLRRLAEPAGVRARLFDHGGRLAADSRILFDGNGGISIEPLDPPRERGWSERAEAVWQGLAAWMPADGDLPAYEERRPQTAGDYPEVKAALDGRGGRMVRRRAEGGMVLSVAAPVQRYKQVVGAVMVSEGGGRLAKRLFQVRLAIIQVFLVALAVTVALSLLMAGAIARPLRRLAAAAKRVRLGRGRHCRIPDLSARGDEIGELSLALKEMTEALWLRMDAIESFAADVAHEIKNPLASLRSAVETAQIIDDPERHQRLLAIIQDDVIRLDRLITDISDASRLDAELSRAVALPVSLGGLIAGLAGLPGPPIVLDRPDDDPLMVMGIEGRLGQVFRNLIANAQSFSPVGGTIRIQAGRQGGRVSVAIIDDGPGIPEGKREAIFARFYSERPAGEKFGAHSGLGLAISRQIVEAHGGTIRAENREGGGACFLVSLPEAGP